MSLKIGVIGCGVVGAAIAYKLSQNPAYEVSVFEARSPEAFGATGAALGVLMAVISPKLKGKHLRMRLESISLFDDWVEELIATTGLDIPYNRQGIVQLMFDEEQFQRWEKTQTVRERQGFKLERWRREQTLERFPFVAEARDIEANQPWVGAIYSPSDRQLDPVALTQALRQAAMKQGAKFHFNSPVEGFTGQKLTDDGQNSVQRIQSIQVKGHPIKLDQVILSAGLGATSLTSQLNQRIEIYPVLGQALRLRLKTPWPVPTPVINGAHVHLVPLNTHEIWVGATVEFPDPETNIPYEADQTSLEKVHHQAIALYPELAKADVIETWSGQRPRPSERAAPVIEWLPSYENVIVATAHYRNGVLLAPFTANKVAEMLRGES